MARLSSELLLTLNDRVSGPARNVGTALNRLDKRSQMAAMGLGKQPGLLVRAGGAMGAYAAGAAAAAAPLAGGFAAVETLKTAANFQSQLVAIQKKGGLSAEALAKVKDEILGIAESGRVAMDPMEIAQAYERGIAAGLPVEQMKQFSILSAQAADAWDMTGEETGNAFAGFQTSLGLATKDARQYADLINSLADSGISDERDIVSFIDRSGAQLKMMGMTNEQIAATGATLLNLKMPAEVASRAMNTLSTKLLTPKSTKKSKQAFAQLYGDADAFTELMKEDANEAMKDFLGRLEKLDKFRRAELLTDILGQGFSDEINRLIAALPELQRNLDMTLDPTLFAGSLERGYQQKLDSLEGRWKVFRSNLQKLQIDLGDLVIGPAGGFLGDAKDAVNDLSHTIEGLRATWDALQSAMGTKEKTGDADKKGFTFGDILDPTGNRREYAADLYRQKRMREVADKNPTDPALGAFGARDMEGAGLAGVLATTTMKARRATGETYGERQEHAARFTHRQAERDSIDAMRQEYGRFLAPGGESFRPGTDAGYLAEDAMRAFSDTVLTVAATISKATGEPVTADNVARRAGIPPLPPQRPAAPQAPMPPERGDVPHYPVPLPPDPSERQLPRLTVSGGPTEDDLAALDARMARLQAVAAQVGQSMTVAPSPEAADAIRTVAAEMDALLVQRDALAAQLAAPMPAADIDGPLSAAGTRAVDTARRVGTEIQTGLSVRAVPTIDTSSIDAAMRKVDALAAKLQAIQGQAARAGAAAERGAVDMGKRTSTLMRSHFSDGGI